MNTPQVKDEIVISRLPYPNDSEQVFESHSCIHYGKGDQLTKLEMSPNNKYTPKVKDKLYFYPDCNVPRYKVREWAKKNNISITVMEDKATAKFATTMTVRKLIDRNVFVKIEKTAFINWLAINKYDKTSDSYIQLTGSLVNKTHVYLQKYGSNVYHFNKSVDWQGRATAVCTDKGLITGYDDDSASIVDEDNYQTYTVTPANLKLVTALLTSNNLYSQEDIICAINEDAIVIDEHMFSRLRDMFLSESESDHLVALEVVANCNINPSLHYVLLLLKEFSSKIVFLKESKHVNFKSLLEYIGLNRGSMTYLSEDKIVNILMDKDVLTMDNIKELAAGIKNVMKEKTDTQHFLISKITVSGEVSEYLKNKQVQKEPVIN
jgi:hypothetical protein